jgi:hypothetical protein
VSEPAEPLAEPFELLVGPAAPHVDLVAGTVTPVVRGPDNVASDDGEPDDGEPDNGEPEGWEPDTEEPSGEASGGDREVAPIAGPAVAPAPGSGAPGSVALGPVTSAGVTAGQAASGRVASGRVVSGRGVTGRGIVVLILLVTGIVGLIEVTIAGHRGHAFAIAFVVTSAIGALVVRRRDLPTAIIAPPLLYCVLIVAMSAVDRNDETGGLLTREGVYIGNAFVTGAPAVWLGTAAAVLIAGYRARASASRVSPAKSPKPANPTARVEKER